MNLPKPTRQDFAAAVVGAALLAGFLLATGATPGQTRANDAPGPYTVVPVATSDQEGARGIILDTRDGRCWIVIGAVLRPLLYDESAAQVLPRLDGLNGRRAPVDITDPAKR